MATLRKRGAKWQVQVRRTGFPGLTKTFHLKEDALRWAREQERLMDLGQTPQSKSISAQPEARLADLLERYEREVLPRKRAAGPIEGFLLRPISRHPIAQLPISQLGSSSIANYRDFRIAQVSASTVRRELGLLLHALKIAHHEWGYPVPEIKRVTMPGPNRARDRRLSDDELDALTEAFRRCRNKLVKPVFLFALATGMRRSEVLSLTWSHVDPRARTAFLPMTKNGDCRTVPLSATALAVLDTQAPLNPSAQGRCFPITPNALRLAWERLKRRANVCDLRFHDLRHEAISRFFELGLSVPEVSLISGHKDPRMLFRYTHLKAERLAEKLHDLDEEKNLATD